MIQAASFEREWIYSHRARKGFEKINPPLAEKMIYALALVESLAVTGLDFVFKGGTSLILLMETPGRFSIDIDIVTTASREEIEVALSEICTGSPFRVWKLNEKRSYKAGIPKAHYALVYTSKISGKEDHILLDILFDKHPYPALVQMPVITEWLVTDGAGFPVKMPTHESIAGDKLTAFAPNTTGVPYNAGKELEIVKQLFDVGRLYHNIKDMAVTMASFDITVEKEIGYRGGGFTREHVIQDIIQTGLLIAQRGKNIGGANASGFQEIQRGLLQFKAYQMSDFFRIEDAVVSSAKAALMAARIKAGESGPVEFYTPNLQKQDYLIQNKEYDYLNKLSPEPLFYWHKAMKSLGLI